MKKILTVLDTVLTITLVAIALGILVPMLFGIRPSVVMSNSMHGVYDAGALCFIDYRDTDVEVGDIVCYSLGEELITHRVVGVDEDGLFILKGDNNDAVDFAPVSQDQIKGTVRFWVPYCGVIVSWIRTTTGAITLVTVVVVYAILSYMGRKWLSEDNTWN